MTREVDKLIMDLSLSEPNALPPQSQDMLKCESFETKPDTVDEKLVCHAAKNASVSVKDVSISWVVRACVLISVTSLIILTISLGKDVHYLLYAIAMLLPFEVSKKIFCKNTYW